MGGSCLQDVITDGSPGVWPGCKFEVSEHLSPRLMVQGLAGAALFFNADLLTHSSFFRLSTGTLGFTALSLGIVLFILYRHASSCPLPSLGFTCVPRQWRELPGRPILPGTVAWLAAMRNRHAMATLCFVSSRPGQGSRLSPVVHTPCSAAVAERLTQVWRVCRSVPNKKTLMAGAALFGSSMLGVVRWFFGAWIPSYDQLIYNKVCPMNPSVLLAPG